MSKFFFATRQLKCCGELKKKKFPTPKSKILKNNFYKSVSKLFEYTLYSNFQGPQIVYTSLSIIENVSFKTYQFQLKVSKLF